MEYEKYPEALLTLALNCVTPSVESIFSNSKRSKEFSSNNPEFSKLFPISSELPFAIQSAT